MELQCLSHPQKYGFRESMVHSIFQNVNETTIISIILECRIDILNVNQKNFMFPVLLKYRLEYLSKCLLEYILKYVLKYLLQYLLKYLTEYFKLSFQMH